MKVNRNNYEVWMIDYFDGILNADGIGELMAFLDQNPDLREEFELFDSTKLSADDVSFASKNKLKKTPIQSVADISEENYEEAFVAYYENDSDTNGKENLHQFVEKNPHLEKEFRLHAKLILTSDNSIKYPDKATLKKKAVIGVYWRVVSAAAIVVFLAGIYLLMQQVTNEFEREFLSVNKIESRSVITTISIDAATSLPARAERIIIVTEFIIPDEPVERYILASIPSKSFNSNIAEPANHALIYQPQSFEDNTLLADASDMQQTEKKNGLLAKIASNYASRVSVKRTERANKEKNKKEPGFVKFLDQSITVFNTVTGSDTEMIKSYDNNGNLTHYQVDGQTISWSRDFASISNSE